MSLRAASAARLPVWRFRTRLRTSGSVEASDSLERAGVPGRKAVHAGDQFLLEPAGDEAAGVVVRGVGDAEPARPLQQMIAGKRMSQRRVIVLALGGEVEMAVLADPEIAQRA